MKLPDLNQTILDFQILLKFCNHHACYEFGELHSELFFIFFIFFILLLRLKLMFNLLIFEDFETFVDAQGCCKGAHRECDGD